MIRHSKRIRFEKCIYLSLVILIPILYSEADANEVMSDKADKQQGSFSNNDVMDSSKLSEEIEISRCDINKTFKAYFSSRDDKDEVHVSAKGNPCVQGRYEVTVYSKGTLLYKYDGKVSDLFVDPLGKTIGDLSEELNSAVKEVTASSWPEYANGTKQDQDMEEEDDQYHYSISKKEYDVYRKMDALSLSVTTYYDETVYLIYDAQNKKGIIAWSSGL